MRARSPEGNIVYSLSIVPQAEAFTEAMRRQDLPAGWPVAIFDRQGVTVARNLSPERVVGQKPLPALLERLLTKQEGAGLFFAAQRGPLYDRRPFLPRRGRAGRRCEQRDGEQGST